MHIKGTESVATTRFLDIEFANLSFDRAVELTLSLARANRMSVVVTPNVDHVNMINSRRRADLASALQNAYLASQFRFCDSRILARIGRLFGKKLYVVPGSDLTAMLFKRQFGGVGKIAIVGGDADTIASLGRLLPEHELCQHIPPMGIISKPGAMDAVVDFVTGSRADFTLFAIGCPQSEILATCSAKHESSRGVALCIGASLDFVLGKQTRAPRWVRRAGFEWAYRLLREPKRMWRRYLVEGPRIFVITAKWYVRNRRVLKAQNG